jgi:hypothetical protein
MSTTEITPTVGVDESPERASAAPRKPMLWKRRRSLAWWQLLVGALVVLTIGAASGGASKIDKAKYDEALNNVTSAKERATMAESRADTRVKVAEQRAEDAESAARKKIEAEFDQKQAKVDEQNAATKAQLDQTKAQLDQLKQQLDQRSQQLDQRQAAITVGEVAHRKDSIDTDGVYEVGTDINVGKWKYSGDGSSCYYAILGSSDTSNIVDNNNVSGPAIVVLARGQYFEVGSGCGTWNRVG